MDKEVLKEIFLLILEVIMAFCEMVWKKIRGSLCLVWDRFFGVSDVSSPAGGEDREWGVIGEDTWPTVQKTPQAKAEEPPPGVERKESLSVPTIPELPENYGDNRIVLMVRDTEWLFAYWELRKDVLDNILNTLGSLARSAKMVLRVYDVTGVIFNGNNAHNYLDIDVTGGTQSWYIHAGKPNRSFCADIGFLSPNGTFRLVVRSNPVTTPRSGVSEVVDETWMSIEALYERISASGGLGFGMSESVFKRAHKDWQEILKGDISSPESPRVSSVSKR